MKFKIPKFLLKKTLGNKGGEITKMTIDEIKKLIQNGEKIDVEFKESRNALTKDVFDTVCSFNNRNGGHILLGVNDKRDIVGVSEDKVDKIIKEFTTSINNSQKMYPPLYLLPEVFELDSKITLTGTFTTFFDFIYKIFPNLIKLFLPKTIFINIKKS